VRVYRTGAGWALTEADDEDVRDYDTEHYVRSLRANYATRMAAHLPERTSPPCSLIRRNPRSSRQISRACRPS
jgi:hypothetical protein